MLTTVNKKVYKAFGFYIISEILFTELESISSDIKEKYLEITIELADLNAQWEENCTSLNEFLIIKEAYVMFNVPGNAIFLIEGGNKIRVSPQKDYDEDIVKLFLLGTCMGIILMQNRILPLHGSVMEINGKAYAFIGNSGVGKSTLASAFLKRGFKLLSDDVIPIRFSKDNIPFITPSYPQQKLWQDSMEHYGLDPNGYQSIFGRETKFCIPVDDSQFSSQALSLGGIFELVKSEGNNLSITPIQKLSRFLTIFEHTYRNMFISGLGLTGWHFEISAKILKTTNLFRIQRPENGFSANSMVTEILNIIDDYN